MSRGTLSGLAGRSHSLSRGTAKTGIQEHAIVRQTGRYEIRQAFSWSLWLIDFSEESAARCLKSDGTPWILALGTTNGCASKTSEQMHHQVPDTCMCPRGSPQLQLQPRAQQQ
jgi:hypothetical protein